MRRATPSVASFLFLTTLVLLPASVSAQSNAVQLNGSSFALEWQANAPAERLVLTVSRPDGQVSRKEINGSSAALELIDEQGQRLPDGAYTWQLEVVPRVSRELRQQLAALREAGDEAGIARLQAERLPARAIESGSFRVEGGAFVTPGSPEASSPRSLRQTAAPTASGSGGSALATRDQVIPDDLIVQGSGCFGFDCVNNESFGFDTIRLKENNLRIGFDDTSVGAFPANDWQLTANDSASGGANKFSIDDITGSRTPFTVTAGAATNSIFVDSTGRVGFRTATPVLDLHVATSNTPAMRLEQNNSGGFTAQTWDVAGNEANFFVRDVTSGSRLPFRIRPGAPTSSIDIASDGDVGIGTASPQEKLDVTGAAISNIQVTTFSAGVDDRADLIVRRARGTSGAPTAVQLNDRLGGFQARGHNGTGFSALAASFDVRAEENFTATANGTRMVIQTTPNGTITPTTRMVIRQNGRVGVGTTSPTELFHVSGGNILVSGGGFFDDGAPVTDFVFEPDYRLMPLDELKTFVTTNKHLPNVPSKDDAKAAGGVNIGLYSMRILEKVEELTLYTIDQHEQIQTLEAENAELKSRLAKIEAALAALAQN